MIGIFDHFAQRICWKLLIRQKPIKKPGRSAPFASGHGLCFNGRTDVSGWRPDAGNRVSAITCYRCNACSKTYTWRSSYQRHLREECGKDLKATCQNCGKQYRWRDSLKKHLKNECSRVTRAQQDTPPPLEAQDEPQEETTPRVRRKKKRSAY